MLYHADMDRFLMTELLDWKKQPNRKPLILKGVRQCGKTHLLEQFGKLHFKNYHIINFESDRSARTLFDSDLNPNDILTELRFYLKSDIDIYEDLLIFDEIQACPNALTSLKYFCEKLPELALCSAGSLLGIHLNEGSYPVGKVDMKYLHPMTFSEFLNGIKDSFAHEYLNNITIKLNISEASHQHLWERLKQYFVTGGLPEPVKVFRDHQDNLYNATINVRTKQEELIRAYYADIAKHAGKVNAMHIDRTWKSVPKQLSEHLDDTTSRFKFKGVIPNVNRYSQMVNVIDWLNNAELIIKLSIVNTVAQPLNSYSKDNIFKLMMFDVGILGATSELDPKVILDYDYGTFQGYFAENFVAQQLIVTNKSSIYSWQKDKSEIEFLLPNENEIIPLEVKSSKRVRRAKSLEKYINMYSPRKSVILSNNHLRMNKSQSVIHLPLYLAERIRDFI